VSYAILHVEKVSSKAHFKAIQGHNDRLHVPDNVDPGRSHLNEDFLSPSLPLWDAIEHEISTRVNGRVRCNSVRGVQIFLSASPEYFRDDPDAAGTWNQGRLDNWRAKSVDFLRREYGQNLLDVKLHLDEDTPHIHAVVVPIDAAGKLSANRGMLAKPNLVKLQDKYGDKMAPLGLERGISGSGARKISARDYSRLVKIAAEPLPKLPPQPKMTFIDQIVAGKEYKKDLEAYKTAVKKRNQELSKNAQNAVLITANNRLLERRVKDLTASNVKLSAENNRLKELAAKLRPLPIKTVLDEYKKYHPDSEKAGGVEIISDDKFQTSSRTGRNAIDLVMHLEDCDYKTAVRVLAANYTEQDIKATVTADQIDKHPMPGPGGRVSWKQEAQQSTDDRKKADQIQAKVSIAMYKFDDFFRKNWLDMGEDEDAEKLREEVEKLREEYKTSIREQDTEKEKKAEREMEKLKSPYEQHIERQKQEQAFKVPKMDWSAAASDPATKKLMQDLAKNGSDNTDQDNKPDEPEEKYPAPAPGPGM
jgi:hypothetical protein